jgi:hypothetical protein
MAVAEADRAAAVAAVQRAVELGELTPPVGEERIDRIAAATDLPQLAAAVADLPSVRAARRATPGRDAEDPAAPDDGFLAGEGERLADAAAALRGMRAAAGEPLPPEPAGETPPGDTAPADAPKVGRLGQRAMARQARVQHVTREERERRGTVVAFASVTALAPLIAFILGSAGIALVVFLLWIAAVLAVGLLRYR